MSAASDPQTAARPCACSECRGLGRDADSRVAARYKQADPSRTLPKATGSQVRYIEGLSRRLTKGEASRLIEHLRSTTAGRS